MVAGQMIDESIIQAYEMVRKTSPLQKHLHKTQWQVLFDYYNAQHEKQLNTCCMPCYPKVLSFAGQQIRAHVNP